MSLILCPECAKQISDQAFSCPNCGFPLSKLESGNVSHKPLQSQLVTSDDMLTNSVKAEEYSNNGNDNSKSVTKESPIPEMTSDVTDIDKLLKYILGALAVIILFIIVIGHLANQEKERQNAKIGKERLEIAKSLMSKPNATSIDWIKAKKFLESVPSIAPQYAEAKSLLTQKVESKIAEYNEAAAKEAAKKASIAEESRLTSGGKRVRAKHPEWDVEDCNTIASGKIQIGMTREQVRAAWGRPHDINRTSTANGTNEQWVMTSGLPTTYVYFEDGICTAVQN